MYFFSFLIKAQAPTGGANKDMMKALKDIKGRVYGKIIDAKTKKPVEFASVVVLWYNKDSLLGGALTKENGEFAIEGLPSIGAVLGFVPHKLAINPTKQRYTYKCQISWSRIWVI